MTATKARGRLGGRPRVITAGKLETVLQLRGEGKTAERTPRHPYGLVQRGGPIPGTPGVLLTYPDVPWRTMAYRGVVQLTRKLAPFPRIRRA